ncbi:class I SAM-dependent methyltransferase [Anaerocolumna sp. MB42-C2]|uniref:class I SAM-dependent methyltransferase n=1 Tax=Anaerocolumna sp. MB42-C2 TaxID=3070997 RepID=UPI0027E07EC0|nr:class I SAM-dependent methyltransferase [Anaerocolumna sp. MB42-C2]WMJ90140.1 class I SAM-dependent methyltransferase [Anaerocolumna sp. MB42-C2]
MNKKYEKAIDTENNIYMKTRGNLSVPKTESTGWKQFDKAIDWLCYGTENILDFGCGNGSLLFLCAIRGTKKHYGIDLASEGISCAKMRANMMEKGEYQFKNGSTELIRELKDKSMDGIILSNIIDNMYPDDVRELLTECKRILTDKGRVLVKLNPFITKEQIIEWNMKELDKDLYDDGFILWNRPTDEWRGELNSIFTINDEYEFLIPEAEQVNRIFLLTN